MKVYKYFLLHNKKLKPWIKYWLYIKSKDKNYVLSDILDGTSFYLENSSNKNFNLFQINGNSIQDETPTPSSPALIKSAGDAKNLYYLPEAGTSNGITYSINEDGTINLSGTATTAVTFPIFKSIAEAQIENGATYTFSSNQALPSGVEFRAEAYNNSSWLRHLIGGVINSSVSSSTGTANLANATRIRHLIYIASGTTVNLTNLGIQFEKGNTQTSFTPEGKGFINETISNSDNTQSQNFTIPCQQPMRSIGNVRDGFVKQDGIWYEKHNLRERILNGNENWISQAQTGFYRYGLSDSVINNETSYASQIVIKSNNFKGITFNNRNSDTNETIYVVSNGQQHNLFINTKSYTTLNDFKNWLTGNNIEVLYLLNEPNYIQCTQEQVQALESITQAHTYKHITNINSTDITPAFLKIQYYMEV